MQNECMETPEPKAIKIDDFWIEIIHLKIIILIRNEFISNEQSQYEWNSIVVIRNS